MKLYSNLPAWTLLILRMCVEKSFSTPGTPPLPRLQIHFIQTFIVPPLNPNRQHPYNPQSHGGHLSHPYNNIECLKNPNVPHSKSPHHDTTTHREEGPRNLNGGSPLRSLSLSIPLAEYVSSSSSNSFGRCHCLP